MKQQINLYQESLIAKKPPFHAGLMLRIGTAAVLILLIVSSVLRWQQSRAADRLAVLQAEQISLNAELQDFRVQNPPRQKDPLIEEQLATLQAEFAGRRPLLTYFERFDPGMSLGFSPVIRGLAQYPFKGVWLTTISLNTLDHQILLAGSATKADLVPAYLHHLSVNKVLKGHNFASLKLERLEEKMGQVDFRLESEFGVADEN